MPSHCVPLESCQPWLAAGVGLRESLTGFGSQSVVQVADQLFRCSGTADRIKCLANVHSFGNQRQDSQADYLCLGHLLALCLAVSFAVRRQ